MKTANGIIQADIQEDRSQTESVPEKSQTERKSIYTDPILVFFGTEIAYAPKQFFQPVCGVFQAKNG